MNFIINIENIIKIIIKGKKLYKKEHKKINFKELD